MGAAKNDLLYICFWCWVIKRTLVAVLFLRVPSLNGCAHLSVSFSQRSFTRYSHLNLPDLPMMHCSSALQPLPAPVKIRGSRGCPLSPSTASIILCSLLLCNTVASLSAAGGYYVNGSGVRHKVLCETLLTLCATNTLQVFKQVMDCNNMCHSETKIAHFEVEIVYVLI